MQKDDCIGYSKAREKPTQISRGNQPHVDGYTAPKANTLATRDAILITDKNFKTAYVNQPVIMIVRPKTMVHARIIERRLASFHGVAVEAIQTWQQGRLAAYFINGSYDTNYAPEIVYDDKQFTASASPVLESSVIDDPSGGKLVEFVRRLRAGEDALARDQVPMCVFQCDADTETAVGINDSFGIGRLYWFEDGPVAAMGNNIASLALAREGYARQEAAHWDTYYTSGGAVGDVTYMEGIYRAPEGSEVLLQPNSLNVDRPRSMVKVLQESYDRKKDSSCPVNAALRLLSSARPFFKENLSIGLSGGRDSRLVTALAINAGLNFNSFTAVPPDLEGDIARELHEKSRTPFKWERRDKRTAAANARSGSVDLLPILDRAEAWFEFSGGDNWSTYIRRNPVRRTPLRLSAMSLSGAFGDFTRGHYYTPADVAQQKPEEAIQRHLRGNLKIRRFIPYDVRLRGTENIKSSFERMNAQGFEGFDALNLAFLTNRMRRQFPYPAPNTLLPLMTVDMVSELFWDDPLSKLEANGLREMTRILMPEWSSVPYFHEAAVGTDPMVTNKVSIQPTYWEVDRENFLESAEHSLATTRHIELSMDRVRQEIDELPEGRTRTNTTFEYIFWHYGATALLDRVNDSIVSHPI